jgi:hypothetical protein
MHLCICILYFCTCVWDYYVWEWVLRSAFLIFIFLHQDSRTWFVLLFFVFLFLCVLVYMISLWQCTLVLLFSRFLKVLFVCFCLFASSFKNNIMSQLFASSTPSHSTPFQSNHELKFALKIVEWYSCRKVVISVWCEFCVYHGHE